MKKKPSIVIHNDNEKTKKQRQSKANKNSEMEQLSKQTKLYPVEIINETIDVVDSALDDMDNLNDSDESSIKVAKRKTISRKKSETTITDSVKKPQSKKSKSMSTANESLKCSAIPKRKKDSHNIVSDSSIISNTVDSSLGTVTDSVKKAQSKKSKSVSTLNESLKCSPIPKRKKDSRNIVSDSSIISNTVDSSLGTVESGKCESEVVTTVSHSVNTSTVVANVEADDMGINIADIADTTVSNLVNANATSNPNNTQKLPEALLRCAFIQNSNSQTVVYWCEELTKWSFKCQNKIMSDIREGKNWVTREIPFASQVTEPPYSLYLHRNNVAIKGMHGSFGIRLFHYTLRTNFQTELNMKNTARRIVKYTNEDCKANLIFDENRLFLYKKPCVWSNLIGKKGALDKLVRDTNEVLNERFSSNPKLWDNHMELIKKFFFVNKLQLDVAELLNAPLENIDNCIERTAELIASVSKRRNFVPTVNASQLSPDIDIDPEDEVSVENVTNKSTQDLATTTTSENETNEQQVNVENPEYNTEYSANITET
jgi:hypothetical protein